MTNIKTKLKGFSKATVVALLVSMFAPFMAQNAAAAVPVLYARIQMDRMAVSTNTTGSVCASISSAQSSVATETAVWVAFPATYTTAAFGSWTVNSTTNASWPSGAVAWTGISAPTSANGNYNGGTGNVIKFFSGNLPSATAAIYCFNWTTASNLTHPASAAASEASYVATYSGAYPGTTNDFVNFTATQTLAGASGDNITISNTIVPPIFTMTFADLGADGAQLDSLNGGTLSALQTRYNSPGNTVTVQTNAASGYVVFAKGTYGATCGGQTCGTLFSTTANNKLPVSRSDAKDPTTASHSYVTTNNNSGEDYGLSTAVTGGGSADANYADTTCTDASNCIGVIDGAAYRPIAAHTAGVVASVITIKFHAAISTSTASAQDYTDTVYIVGAGKF